MKTHREYLDQKFEVRMDKKITERSTGDHTSEVKALADLKIWQTKYNNDLQLRKSKHKVTPGKDRDAAWYSLQAEFEQLRELQDHREHFDVWKEDRAREALEAFRVVGKGYDPACESESEAFVRVLIGPERATAEPDVFKRDVAMLRHSLWQVKRKIQGLPTKNETFLCLNGPQESGKTHALKELGLRKLGIAACDFKSLTDISDSRNDEVFSLTFFNLVEELQGAKRADIEKLKALVSAEYITFRPMRTTESVKAPQRVTFFGTTNKSIYDVVRDSTGMRRFYEINTCTFMDRAEFAKIDFNKVWLGINAEISTPHYFDSVKAEVTAVQKANGYVTNVIEWVQEESIRTGDHFVKGEFLYNKYVERCAKSRHETFNRTEFYKELRRNGFKEERFKNLIYFLVDKEASKEISSMIMTKNSLRLGVN